MSESTQYDPAEVINAKLKARKTNPEPIGEDGNCRACGAGPDPVRDHREVTHKASCAWVLSWHPEPRP